MSDFDKLDKTEDINYVYDPNVLKAKDAPLETLVAFKNAAPGFKQIGIGNSELLEPCPVFNKAPAEHYITHRNLNCGITLGRDRPSGILSGFGALGTKRSATIDIVAGRLGPESAAVNKQGELLYCDNNFAMDASRIYISQRTNIDQNFLLKSVINTPSKNCAAIGIKSDSIRLIARKDVRIVTGTDYYDSRGRQPGVDYELPCRISLVGDNRDDLLQPMVKGLNLQSYLLELTDAMHGILSTIDALILHQNKLNLMIINHTHRDRLNVNSFGFPSEQLIFNGMNPAIKLVTDVKASLLELTGMIEASTVKYVYAPNDYLMNNLNILSGFNYCN